MSYIHCSGGNYYTPSKNLQGLFESQVIRPFERAKPTVVEFFRANNWQNIKNLRHEILESGLADFDEPSEDFSPEDKVLFYCYNYMPMHLFSSYHIFKNYLPSISEKIVFIDFGCGPLTSGIAFWAAFAGQGNITYIGIDKSEKMRNMAKRINEYGPYGSSENFYNDFILGRDYNGLPRFLSNEIKLHNPADTLVIFNFCYFLQTKTLESPSEIEKLGNVLHEADIDTKVCMVYQDPVKDEFQGRWHNLKSWVITYHSMYDVSGFTGHDPTQVVEIKYDTLWGEQNPVDVSYDSFNNFSFFENYS
ncbi:MAG: class I SAM-dependent methyltransferase [Candidatus Poribacteria bacterium]|nr:class I SAM-dependent methyltransferase [Candidatus Poribacteria bacterium]